MSICQVFPSQLFRPLQGQLRAYNSNTLDKVELKAQVVFDTCWRNLEGKLKQVWILALPYLNQLDVFR